MGENVTTRGLDLLGLPTGTRLYLGSTAVIEITGLRNPCAQLDGIESGLMAATLDRSTATRRATGSARPASWRSSTRTVMSGRAMRSASSFRPPRIDRSSRCEVYSARYW
jgi:hypothetical protein